MYVALLLEQVVEDVHGQLGEQPFLSHQLIDGLDVLDLLLELFILASVSTKRGLLSTSVYRSNPLAVRSRYPFTQ
jgi:hypothetical protein